MEQETKCPWGREGGDGGSGRRKAAEVNVGSKRPWGRHARTLQAPPKLTGMSAAQGGRPQAEAAQPKDCRNRVSGHCLLPHGGSRVPPHGCQPPTRRSDAATPGQD